MALLDLDARWRRFNDPDRACPCCGRQFSGVFDIGFDHPTDWSHGERGDEAFLKVGDDQLTADLCRAGDGRFLRAVISLPIQGSDDEMLHISPWVRPDAATFYSYLDSFDGGTPPAPSEALLANQLPGFEDETDAPLPVTLHFPGPDSRPIATALPADPDSSGDSPLAKALKQGISFDQLLDIYAAFGQDIRPHLQQD